MYMELDELIKHGNIINYVKSQRLSWFGHINRMPETSVVKKMQYTGCNRRNGPNFGRVFLMLNYTEKNTYI
jgi:hypothetical protein